MLYDLDMLQSNWLSGHHILMCAMGSRNGLIERFYTLLSRSLRLSMQFVICLFCHIVPFLLARLSDIIRCLNA